jgi:hypothetical protein
MAETYLIASPARSEKNGKIYRVVKDRAWNDMPFSYLVQVRKINYSHGKNVATWVYCDKFPSQEEAVAKFLKRVGG